MKKFLILLIVILLTAGAAHAVPFQIAGGSLDVDWDLNLGDEFVNYTPFISGPIELAEGESADIIFGQIDAPTSLGWGTATVDVDFSSPTFDDDVAVSGDFIVASVASINKPIISASAGSLTFDQPGVFSYSYNGAPGGMLTVEIDGIVGAQLGTAFNITGKITNTAAPAPVPEPATMLLLGTGLVGLAGASRKRLLKKS